MRKNKKRDLKLEEKIRMEAYSWIKIIRSCNTFEHYRTVNSAWYRIFYNRWYDRYDNDYLRYYIDMLDDETENVFKRLHSEAIQEIDNCLNTIKDDIQNA